jgi:hypothetical protein
VPGEPLGAGDVVGDGLGLGDDLGLADVDASRAATAAEPSLLKPIRLTSARSSISRNSRGAGLPGWGSAVTVPIST